MQLSCIVSRSYQWIVIQKFRNLIVVTVLKYLQMLIFVVKRGSNLEAFCIRLNYFLTQIDPVCFTPTYPAC